MRSNNWRRLRQRRNGWLYKLETKKKQWRRKRTTSTLKKMDCRKDLNNFRESTKSKMEVKIRKQKEVEKDLKLKDGMIENFSQEFEENERKLSE